jgi:uncharacterized protein YegP (UPF0339 family)
MTEKKKTNMDKKYTLQFYKYAAHRWGWQIVARNGRIIAESAVGYERLYHCRRAIKNLLATAHKTPEAIHIGKIDRR